jgi:streptomycin 6-kinase
MATNDPSIDPGARDRLRLRFGADVDAWFDRLPGLLTEISSRWRCEIGAAIPRGSVSTVFHCRAAGGTAAVLKVSPDRARILVEASGLSAWRGRSAPYVIEVDEELGALLLEEVEPGTTLAEGTAYPAARDIGQLLRSLHDADIAGLRFPSLIERVDALFRSSEALYRAFPDLGDVIAPELYERGWAEASELANDQSKSVLLHGDLTPSNILVGEKGTLVAIDPAPCLGDPAFDAVDLTMWRARELATIEKRAWALSEDANIDPTRLLAWCSAFAGMNALELASKGAVEADVEPFVALASQRGGRS